MKHVPYKAYILDLLLSKKLHNNLLWKMIRYTHYEAYNPIQCNRQNSALLKRPM